MNKAFFYPPTKAKLHRLVSIVGTMLTVAVVAWAWLVKKQILTSTEALGVSLGALTVWASSWKTLIAPKAAQFIDGLDIPDGATVTQNEKITDTKTTTITPASEDLTTPARPSRVVKQAPVPSDPTKT